MAKSSHWHIALLSLLVCFIGFAQGAITNSGIPSAQDISLNATVRGHDVFPCEMVNRELRIRGKREITRCNQNVCRWRTIITRTGRRINAGGHCEQDSIGRCRMQKDHPDHALPTECHNCSCRKNDFDLAKTVNPGCRNDALTGFRDCFNAEEVYNTFSNTFPKQTAGKRKRSRRKRNRRRS